VSKTLLLRLLSFYPPLLGAGIRVHRLPDGYESSLRLSLFNRNYFGTHFGGSLYAMCDPFFVLILAERLGRDYIVWDKAATIRFKRPGRGRVRARFQIPPERSEEIRTLADRDGKVEPTFTAQVLDQEDNVVAEVDKLLHVRPKSAKS
jgi:hypothetical protein